MGMELLPNTTGRDLSEEEKYFVMRLQSKDAVEEIDITPMTADHYRGDFTGLLIELGIPVEKHLLLLQLNGLPSSIAYNGKKTKILLTNDRRIDDMIGGL